MTSSLVKMAATTGEAQPMLQDLNAYVAGAVMLAILLFLLLMTWAFRSMYTRD